MNINHLMPTDKIIITFMREMLKKNTPETILNWLIEQNTPFKNKDFKYQFVKKLAYFMQLAIDLNDEPQKKTITTPKLKIVKLND